MSSKTTKFACPKCGSEDDFVRNYTVVYWEHIDHIDANTGHVAYTGDSDSNHDEHKDLGFECTNCSAEVSKDDFDPTKRLLEAMTGIDDLMKDLLAMDEED